MATNPSTLPENAGRITAPDTDYPYGSAKDDSTGATGDGTPIKRALLNDTYGIIQHLLTRAGIVPSGTAETAQTSQVVEALDAIYLASRPVDNRVKGNQNWNIRAINGDPLISATPANYSVGEFPAIDVEVTTAATNLKYLNRVVSSDDNTGVLTITWPNDNPDITAANQYVGVVLADGSQAEAGLVAGVSKSDVAAGISCSVDLSVITGGFKYFFICDTVGAVPETTDDDAEFAYRGFLLVENANGRAEVYRDGRIKQVFKVAGQIGAGANPVAVSKTLPVPITASPYAVSNTQIIAHNDVNYGAAQIWLLGAQTGASLDFRIGSIGPVTSLAACTYTVTIESRG